MAYRTMQGKEIDFEKLMKANELTPAVGNMKVNARGDQLGPGGRIVRKREEIVADYYENNPKAQPKQIIKPQEASEDTPVAAPKPRKNTTTEE
jgi:hypothetical protein